MGFERILGELSFRDEADVKAWREAELDPFDVFAPDDFWTHMIEAAHREGQIVEDPPQNVKDLLESVDFGSAPLDVRTSGNTVFFDALPDSVEDDPYMIEAFKLAVGFGRAAEFGAHGELRFSDGWHAVESTWGTTYDVTVEVAHGEVGTHDTRR